MHYIAGLYAIEAASNIKNDIIVDGTKFEVNQNSVGLELIVCEKKIQSRKSLNKV